MDLKYFKERLEKDREKLKNQISVYSGEDPFSQERFGEDYDEGITEIESHDRISATKEELKGNLDAVENALERIKKGTYGICENCKGKISEERLKILPTATLCLNCEKK